MTEKNITEEPAVNRTGKRKKARTAPPLPPDPVRLVASARFYAESIMVPPGISSRDKSGFLEGEVEELSLFPLESTSWGYMENPRKLSGAQVLLYAAFREHVNGATDPDHARRFAVLPGFAVLLGRQWRKPTWLVLLEPECVTLVRMQPKANLPDFVRSRYGTRLDEDSEAAWELRERLLDEVAIDEDGERIEEGLVRAGRPAIDRRGAVVFPLERQRTPQAGWKRFGCGKLASEAALLAADVRDMHFLADERKRRRAVRQLRAFLRIAAVVLVLLGVFQYLYLKRVGATEALAAQSKAQRPAVKALQEQESLAKSASRLANPPLEIFEWLSVVNDPRPDTLFYTTAYADREANLGFSGEAPSVAVVNQYREALEKTGRFSMVEVKELNSAKQGVKFTIQVKVKPAAEVEPPPAEPQAEVGA
ncbi:hypothetical protein PDESU_02820 [Pontiella desulfatans]|uniref:Uncharacterized protein n=1 Tax=Pontiella desulfatans TaxID=2750659 RepID=A0A6C2U3Y6_PONDE|nr:hypothetical protein [Pontiella desulfatans]VGO14261.1 hypothetical protein PDESU_02820 [Pontiella desulfatans]